MNLNNSLGIIEFKDVASGYRIANDIIKNVSLRKTNTIIVQPHKLILFIEDNYQNIEYATFYAIDKSDDHILDLQIIGNVDERVYKYLNQETSAINEQVYYLGLFSVKSISEGINLANDLLLNYELTLLKLDFSNYMHGKCLVIVTGNIATIKNAIDNTNYGELLTMPEKDIIDSILGG